VCPEFIFDQEIGSIFEVRNAGNVVDDDVMASLEYAVEHLHVSLVVVLAHKGCGAIAAVHEAGDVPLHDHLRALQDHMPGIHQEVLRTHGDNSAVLLNRLAKENARQQAIRLRHESDPIRMALARGDCRLMYAVYDIETGRVDFFDLD
jgi:carbonic anhydrase